MNNKNSLNSAFSLIELSIVILIIGILVAGVTQSSRLISRIKLTTLQSLTRSSDVISINGLSLWLETTLDNSLTNSNGSFEISNNDTVSSWNDINPQVTNKINIGQTNTANQPVYKLNSINDLPALSFSSSQHLISRPFTPISLGDKNYTIVLVWKTYFNNIAFPGQVVISQSDDPGNCNQLASFFINSSTAGFAGACNDYMPLTIQAQTNYITIITVDNNLASNNISLYVIPNPIFKRTKKIKILTSYFWLKIFKKPQLYEHTASFFKDFYLKNILL